MSPDRSQPMCVGRYLLHGPIASGGMATVHLGRLVGTSGFSRTVAIKRLHPQLVESPEVAASLLDEARLVCRIQHPNVISVLDLVVDDEEAFLVMEYVHGESLSRLLAAVRARGERVPVEVVGSVLSGVLQGLHAAHEAKSEDGEPLDLVHRDVSPENVLVGGDGIARLLDFGIAKAHGRLSTTRGAQLKGKLAYMAPEQILCGEISRRTDVYAAGVVLWEALTAKRLFQGSDEGELMTKVLGAPIEPPSRLVPDLPAELDAIVMKALERNAQGRHATARDFAIALEHATRPATPREVGEWVERVAGDVLAKRAERVAVIERTPAGAGEADPAPTSTRAVAMALAPATPPPSPPAGPSRAFVAVSAAALLGGAGVAMLWSARRPGPPEEAGGVSAVATTSASAAAAPSGPPVATATPTVTASSEATAPATPRDETKPRSADPGRAKGSSPPAAGGAPDSKRCKPPYTIDETGVRRLKPECI